MTRLLCKVTCWSVCLWAVLMAVGCAGQQPVPSTGSTPVIPRQLVARQVIDSLEEVIARLTADTLVESVQANQFFESVGTVHNDQYARLQYGVQAVRADDGYRQRVRVAVVDTGIDVEHPICRAASSRPPTSLTVGSRA